MKSRPRQVGIELARQLAVLLQLRSKDPRFARANISEVCLSADLAHARVYINCWDKSTPMDELLAALDKARPWLQREIGQRMRLRVIPHLHFLEDPVPQQSEHIEKLLRSLRP